MELGDLDVTSYLHLQQRPRASIRPTVALLVSSTAIAAWLLLRCFTLGV